MSMVSMLTHEALDFNLFGTLVELVLEPVLDLQGRDHDGGGYARQTNQSVTLGLEFLDFGLEVFHDLTTVVEAYVYLYFLAPKGVDLLLKLTDLSFEAIYSLVVDRHKGEFRKFLSSSVNSLNQIKSMPSLT